MIRLLRHNYHFINLLIFFTILAFIIYLKLDVRLVKCPYSEVGLSCTTCGLTTSMRDILNGSFNNPIIGHLLLFLFFVSQLVIRPCVSMILENTKKKTLVANIDIITSIIFASFTLYKLLIV